MASALASVKGGKLTPVALAGQRRSPALPDVPTFAEAGLAGYEMYEWNAVLADREINARLILLGAEVVGSTPVELDWFRRAEIAKWSKFAKQSHIELD